MEQPRPPYVDEHATVLVVPPERVWPAVRKCVGTRLHVVATRMLLRDLRRRAAG